MRVADAPCGILSQGGPGGGFYNGGLSCSPFAVTTATVFLPRYAPLIPDDIRRAGRHRWGCWGLALAVHAIALAVGQQAAPSLLLPQPLQARLQAAPPSIPVAPAMPKAASVPQRQFSREPAREVIASVAASAAPAQATSLPAAAPEAAPPRSEPAPLIAARFDADYLHNPKPAYPALSRRLQEEGKVLLTVRVSPQGQAAEVSLRQGSGYSRLDQAALEAVARWRFVPARRGEQAVESVVTVPVAFTLE